MEGNYAGYPTSFRSSVFGLIVHNNPSVIEIAQRAEKILARFFIALLFFFLIVVSCQADNQSSVMQRVISQRSVPSSNLFLVSKGFELVVRDMDVYLTMALKGQMPVSEGLPLKDVRGVVQQQKGLLLEMDADIVKALSEEGKRLKQQGASSLLEQHEVFIQRYRQNMDNLLKVLEQIIKADDGQLFLEIEAALTCIHQLIPPKELQEPHPSLPEPPTNVPPFIQLPMDSVTIDEISSSFEEEMFPKNKKQIAPSLQSAPIDESILLAETPDIQITPEIRALAEKLEHSPVKIFEWVYNNIDYTPYYGSFKGSQHTLLEKSGNDWDTCSLLMALYRVSNIPCRYVRGVIRMDIETAMNWIGVKNPQAAGNVFYYSGYPITSLLSSDRQTLLGFSGLEHVIVEAYLPYGNYRGIWNDSTEKIWIPLDPSFKNYEYTEGNLNARNVDFATSTYYAKVQELSPIEYHKAQITGNQKEMRITRQIKQKRFEFLPEVLPYYGSNMDEDKGVYYPYCIWRGSLDTLTSLEERHRFRIFAGAGYSEVEAHLSFPDAYGKRLILSYEPATENDKKVMDEGHFYLAKFKAVFRLDGEKIAEGKKELSARDIGGTELAGIYPIYPIPKEKDAEGNGAIGTVTKFTRVSVGGCHAFVVDTNGDTDRLIENRIQKIVDDIDTENTGLVDERVIGEILNIAGLRYFNNCERQAKEIASLNHYYYQPRISNAILSQRISPIMLAGNVTGIELTNEFIDADVWDDKYGDFLCPVEGVGDKKERNLSILIGANGSYFEHKVLEDTFDVPAVSTVKIIQLANERGIAIRYITADTISVLDGIGISNAAKKYIRNCLTEHPERVIIIPEKEIEYHDWVGIGYIVEDTETGNGGYMISGGLRGGETAEGAGCERALWKVSKKESYWKNVKKAIGAGYAAAEGAQKVMDEVGRILGKDLKTYQEMQDWAKALRWYNEQGYDITDPCLMIRAYKDATGRDLTLTVWQEATNAAIKEALKNYTM